MALPEDDSVVAFSSVVEKAECSKAAAGTMPPLGAQSSRRTLEADEVIVVPNKGK